MIYKFPEGFKWGSATSAHQVEGDNHNDWTEWETSPARIAQLKKEGKDPADFISGKACDSYNRYEEDFDIAKHLNQNIHRFSIEWSRIEPEEGRFDEKEMQHYVNVVKALRDRGIEPMITLWHFTNPVWFAKKQGFINLDSPKYFTRYVKYVVQNLPEVKLWITFNEPDVYTGWSYVGGKWPPQHKSIAEGLKVYKNISRAHVVAYKEIKEIYNNSPADFSSFEVEPQRFSEVRPRDEAMSHNIKIGIVVSNTFSVSGKIWYQKIIGEIFNYFRNLYFLKKTFPHYDFIGLNYYHIDRRVPGSSLAFPIQDWMPDVKWEIYPEGIYKRLKELYKRFKKPIFITENGIADRKDEKRSSFIKSHVYWIWKAIQNGIDVQGYIYWSLLDNFEWENGFNPKFGLVEVDYKTFERHIRPSAYEYARICQTNSLEL